jgi:hypothetical protein
MTKAQLKALQAKPWEKKTNAEREEEAGAYARMSEAELTAVSRPSTKAEVERIAKMPTKAQYEAVQAARGPGRPRVGKGAKRVLISVERGLLARADRFAKDNKLTRSELIARALERVVGRAG